MSANATPNTVPHYPPAQPGYQWDAAIPAFPFANFGKRLLAALVDAAILTAIIAIPVALGGVAIVNSVGTNDNGDVNTVTNGGLLALGIAATLIGIVSILLYEPLLTARKGIHNGQTVGRQAIGIRITNLQGGPISTGQAWGRFLFASFISKNVFYLGYLWMLWDGQKQTWHDKVASTFVLDA
jgi:uncharacterized RDD family membrane protein YckC